MKKYLSDKPVETAWPIYGIAFKESHHSPAFFMAPVNRDYLKIFYVLKGSTTIQLNGSNTITFNEKEIFALPKGMTHFVRDNKTNRTASLYILSIKDDAFAEESTERKILRLLNETQNLYSFRLTPQDECHVNITQALRTIKHEEAGKRPDYDTIVKNTTASMLVLISRAIDYQHSAGQKHVIPDTTEKMNSIKRHIESNFYEPVTLDMLAESADLSIGRFIALFKEMFDCTPIQFLHRKRIDYAKARLKNGSESISAICFDSGFNDISFFYRVFRKYTGFSPLAYKQRNSVK